ncbi:MAG: hypothetical protein U0520_00400 [Candidatus Saccharimonadales bacterium]
METHRMKDAVGNFVFNRRAAVALGVATLIAGVLRIKNGHNPPQRGGWQEISPDEFLIPDPNTPNE